MNSPAQFRRPAAFSPDDPNVVIRSSRAEAAPPPVRRPAPPAPAPVAASSAAAVAPRSAPAAASSASSEAAPDLERDVPLPRRRRAAPWGLAFFIAVGGLVALTVGLSIANLVTDLFARADALGYLGLGLAGVAGIAALAIIVREARGIMRLKGIESLRLRASETLVNDDRKAGRAIAVELLALTRYAPELGRARARLKQHLDDIIDGRDLVRLAERELMLTLDEEARRLILNAAKRVSVVTAVSPRAAIDVLFVLANALGLLRRLSLLYGGRPGPLGLVRLMRQTVSHLAMTGGLAMTDSLVQQLIGQGLAAKVSARLGEGVLNGLLTARLGLAAMEVTRPLPFAALRQPTLQDLAGGLMRPSDRAEAAQAGAASPRPAV